MAKYEIDDDAVLALPNANKFDPQAVGEELERIRSAHSGELYPAHVIEAAKNPKNPLHKHFEWDDKIAAEKFRLDQARLLIRVIRIEDDAGDIRRQYISVRGPGAKYLTIDDVLKSRDLSEKVLGQAEADLRAWTIRYKQLKAEIELVHPAIESLRKRRTKREAERASA